MSRPDEFGLIRALQRHLPEHPGVYVGIGDDAAVLPGRPGMYTLLTTDMLVEGQHFFSGTDMYALGRKALAVNISDIAAMGGYPTFAVVSLGVPDDVSLARLEGLYAGFKDECLLYDVAVVGGDTVRSPVLTINVALQGEVEQQRVLLRKGALVGDKLCVTHRLGEAAAGLLLLQRPDLDVPFAVRQRLLLAQERPVARVGAGRELVAAKSRSSFSGLMVTAAMDVSDGLAGDVRHLCRASGVGAIIDADALPVSDDVRTVCEAAGLDPIKLALTGGEDYELLFTISNQRQGRHLLPNSNTSYTVIGEIVPAREGLQLRRAGSGLEPLEADGFKHF